MLLTAGTVASAQDHGGALSIAAVKALARRAPGSHAVVRGTVTRQRPGVSLYITDQTGSAYINTEQDDPVRPGDVIEVSGMATTNGELAFIDRATYRKIGSWAPPEPADVAVSELASVRHDGQLVRVEATLVGTQFGRYENGLLLRAGDVEFLAWLLRGRAGESVSIPVGSLLRVSGISSLTSRNGRPGAFELLLRDSHDIEVLRQPTWLSSHRLLTAVCIIGAMLVGTVGWGMVQRRHARVELKERERLEEGLRQAQKMEAVGRLAGGIAHDFNNLLTVVIGYSEVIANVNAGNKEIEAAVTEIQSAAARATTLTRQLLAYGRRQMLAPSPLDLNDVVMNMGRMLERVLGGDIQLVTSCSDAPVRVMVDRAQMEQAILNLAMNARTAMPDGGRLTMTARRIRIEDKQRHDISAGEYGVLSVADTGIGMSADVQSHIFEPFFSTKEVGEGSGLGLSMVYGFAKQSGGYVRLKSAPGEGAIFDLAFPLAP
jgi:signal transduction histidine kinase